MMFENITITNVPAVVYWVLDQGGYFDTQKKSLETRSEGDEMDGHLQLLM